MDFGCVFSKEENNIDPVVLEQRRLEIDQTIQAIRTLTELLFKEQNYRTGVISNRLGLSESDELTIKAKLVSLVNKL